MHYDESIARFFQNAPGCSLTVSEQNAVIRQRLEEAKAIRSSPSYAVTKASVAMLRQRGLKTA